MSSFTNRIATALMNNVQHLAPLEKRDWARAMAAELSSTPGGPASLRFALGCCSAAIRLRAEDAYRQVTSDVALGILVGAMFFAHAASPDTRAWPLIWPAAGGAVAVMLTAKGCRSFGEYSLTGARTGVASAFVFFFGGLVFLWSAGAPDLQGRVGVLGIAAGLGVLFSALSAILAGICMRLR